MPPARRVGPFHGCRPGGQIPEFVNASPAALKRIVEQFVDDHSHWRAGNEYLMANDWQGAERMYRKALKIKPTSVEAHHTPGGVLVTRGRVEEAIAQFQKALEFDPRHVQAAVRASARILAGCGRFDEALPHFRKALEIEPDNVRAQVSFADALAARPDGRRPSPITARPWRLRPMTPTPTTIWAWPWPAADKSRRPSPHYQKALAVKPDYAAAHNNLGLALAGRGQIEEAIAHYQKALGLSPTTPRPTTTWASRWPLAGGRWMRPSSIFRRR